MHAATGPLLGPAGVLAHLGDETGARRCAAPRQQFRRRPLWRWRGSAAANAFLALVSIVLHAFNFSILFLICCTKNGNRAVVMRDIHTYGKLQLNQGKHGKQLIAFNAILYILALIMESVRIFGGRGLPAPALCTLSEIGRAHV